jgi:hypothetical protein
MDKLQTDNESMEAEINKEVWAWIGKAGVEYPGKEEIQDIISHALALTKKHYEKEIAELKAENFAYENQLKGFRKQALSEFESRLRAKIEKTELCCASHVIPDEVVCKYANRKVFKAISKTRKELEI